MSKVVFITGGSSGIGKAIGDFLTDKGFIVYGTSRSPERYSSESNFQLMQMDVTNSDSIAKAISEVIKKEDRLDILINNAGVGITGPVEETPDSEIQKAFDTNVFGPIRVMKAVLPQMRSQKSGLVINITSIAGYMGLPYRGIYSATKSALEITTEAMRMEVLQFGVEMTNVAPGDFATNIAAGRYHAPELDSSPYKKAYGNTLKMMNEHVDHGEDPTQMARAIYNIIQTRKPKVRYRVGAFLQKFSVVLRRVLPGRIYERMLMNHYKLK
jgi:short-subunit dehydrogenase